MSFICALILGWMDKRAQRILQRNDNPDGEVAKLTDVKTFKITFWMVSVICVAYYVAIFPFIALGKLVRFFLWIYRAFLILILTYIFSEYFLCVNSISRRKMLIQLTLLST